MERYTKKNKPPIKGERKNKQKGSTLEESTEESEVKIPKTHIFYGGNSSNCRKKRIGTFFLRLSNFTAIFFRKRKEKRLSPEKRDLSFLESKEHNVDICSSSGSSLGKEEYNTEVKVGKKVISNKSHQENDNCKLESSLNINKVEQQPSRMKNRNNFTQYVMSDIPSKHNFEIENKVMKVDESSKELDEPSKKASETGKELDERNKKNETGEELDEASIEFHKTSKELDESNKEVRETSVKLDKTSKELDERVKRSLKLNEEHLQICDSETEPYDSQNNKCNGYARDQENIKFIDEDETDCTVNHESFDSTRNNEICKESYEDGQDNNNILDIVDNPPNSGLFNARQETNILSESNDNGLEETKCPEIGLLAQYYDDYEPSQDSDSGDSIIH